MVFNHANITRSHNTDTIPVCVDGRIWTKTLVFDDKCLKLLKIIWVNHLGKQVKPPDSDLVSSEECCNCDNNNQQQEPVEFEDVFGNSLTTVVKFNNS